MFIEALPLLCLEDVDKGIRDMKILYKIFVYHPYIKAMNYLKPTQADIVFSVGDLIVVVLYWFLKTCKQEGFIDQELGN